MTLIPILELWICNIQALTKMFIDVVKKSQYSDPNIKIGPHQMRKLACSYNKKHFPEHEQRLIVKLGSKSMNVLTRTYIRSVPELHFSCVLPTGTLICLAPGGPVRIFCLRNFPFDLICGHFIQKP